MTFDTPLAVKLVTEREWLVQREVNRQAPRIFHGGVYDRDDLLQEGRLGVLDAIKWWKPEAHEGVLIPPDGWICKAIQDRLINYFYFQSRRNAYTLENPDLLDQEIDVFQDVLPSVEDIDIIFDLSDEAKTFLSCILDPPEALRGLLYERWNSGKPQCKNLFPVLRQWFGWTAEFCNQVVAELKEKCRWQCHSNRHSAKKVNTHKFSSSRD